MQQQNNNNQTNKKSEAESGCIWEKINDRGQTYLSIKLELGGQTHFFKGFLNSHKRNESDNKPKFIIYKSQDNSNKQKHFREIKDDINQEKIYQDNLKRDRMSRLD